MSMGLVSKARKERKKASLTDDKKTREENRQGWANIKVSSLEKSRHPENDEKDKHNMTKRKLVGIVSPPYGEGGSSVFGKTNNKWFKEWREIQGRHNEKVGAKGIWEGYNPDNPSNIGNLPDKKLVGITSPPFENQTTGISEEENAKFNRWIKEGTMKGDTRRGEPKQIDKIYSENPENLGNQQGESYLSAMQQVYEQASQLMPIIVTITKNPTRKGELRRLDLDTAKLLMSCGYRIIDYHRALLFEEKKQATLSGGIKKELKGRLSFFKRLSVQKGNKASAWEDILIGVRI